MTTFSAVQSFCLLLSVGASPTAAAVITNHMPNESGGNPAAVNPTQVCSGSQCGNATGLYQVISFPSRVAQYGDLTNPANNAKAAVDIYNSQGEGAWTSAATTVGSDILSGLSGLTPAQMSNKLDCQTVGTGSASTTSDTTTSSAGPCQPDSNCNCNNCSGLDGIGCSILAIWCRLEKAVGEAVLVFLGVVIVAVGVYMLMADSKVKSLVKDIAMVPK